MVPTKKGLQVQMIDDALELGIRHAGLNVQIGHLLLEEAGPAAITTTTRAGRALHFGKGALAGLDAQVKPLSDAGCVVYAILLARATGRPVIDGMTMHPDADPEAPNQLAAFRTDELGIDVLHGVMTFLAHRYSNAEHGRIWGWIVGNEVNSHWWWYNLGRADLATVVREYEAAVRCVHDAVTSVQRHARVYLSLEHHWNARFAAGDEMQSLPGRALLEAFAARARERSDFAWHLAFHPYPENLFECRTWLDRTALSHDDTPRITFKNLEVLTRFLKRDELRHEGLTRRVILSEQGFHAADRKFGERDQAAAYAYAWKQVARQPTIDAFILHRHVDHAKEGGLRLGLWTNRPGAICTPDRKRLIWDVMRWCDTERVDEVFSFALPVIGIDTWDDLR